MAMTVLDLNKYTFTDKTLFTTIFNGRSQSELLQHSGNAYQNPSNIVLNNENRKVSIKQFIDHVDQIWKDSVKNSIYPYTKIANKYQLKPEFLYSYQEYAEAGDVLINNKNYEAEEVV